MHIYPGQGASAHPSRALFASAASLAAVLLGASSAFAQAPPPAEPAPAGAQPQAAPYGAPPPYGAPAPYGQQPGYYPPPGYAPPPGYGAPPGYAQPSGTYPVGPRIMNYEEGQAVPEGYRVEERARRGLIIGGAVTFGVTYILSAMVGLVAESADRASGGTGQSYIPLYIPLAGPFITIGTSDAKGGGVFVLMVDGLAQVAGAAMFIGGLAAPQKKLVRNDVALSVKPIVTGDTLGLGVSGSL